MVRNLLLIGSFIFAMSTGVDGDEPHYKLACCDNYVAPTQLAQFKQEMLDGSVAASDRVCMYVTSTARPHEEYVGTLQVGAENGSKKCMYELFQTLARRSVSKEDHRRARYWAHRLKDTSYPDAVMLTKGCDDLLSRQCYNLDDTADD